VYKRQVSGRPEELLEARIRHRDSVHVEGFDVHRMFMEAARRILPGILHIDASAVQAFNFNPLHFEQKVGVGYFDHAGRCARSRFRGDYGDIFLTYSLPFVGPT